MFGALYTSDPSVSLASLAEVAREFSPRIGVEPAPARPARAGAPEARDVTLDLTGVARLFGDPMTIAKELRRTAAERGLRVRVAIAPTRTAARLLASVRPGLTVVEPGDEAHALAELPIDRLAVAIGDEAVDQASRPALLTLRRWGLRTLGQFAALPADEVAARLGQDGVAWQRLARGEDPAPLVPALPEERFEEALDLEWPIEGLEPLSFVLTRQFEALSRHLERRDRGAAVLHVRLHLVSRDVHARSLQLPAPMRDAKTLRTLALLDLESHPPAAAIDRVVVAVDPTPGRIMQYSLLARPLPAPEQLSTLLARLDALMGEGRSGAPAAVDSWQPGAFAMRRFAPRESEIDSKPQRHRGTEAIGVMNASNESFCASVPPWHSSETSTRPPVALRRYRLPVPTRVRVEHDRPAWIAADRAGVPGGRVDACAGPWRTSGAWWVEDDTAWDRDEWDVTVTGGTTCRLFRERGTGAWFVEGIVD